MEESKFFKLANKYLKTIARKHTKEWGIDILELLSLLSMEKTPAISGGTSYHTDNKLIGHTWIAGSFEAVTQKEQADNAAYKIIEIVRRYRDAEELCDEYIVEMVREELDEAFKIYDGIDTNIYFLFDEVSNAIKVGRSVNVDKRIKNLQTGSPIKMKLIYKCSARTAWDNLIKEELADYKIRDEWFKADERVFKFILWLKYVQENKMNPELVSRNKYDDETLFKTELNKILNKV